MPTLRKRYPRAAPAVRSFGPPGLLSSGQWSGGIPIQTLSGTAIDGRTALTIAAVYNAVQIYANTIASLDFHIAERVGRNGQGRKAVPDHPSYDLVALKPNRIQTSFRFRQTIAGHAVCRGNGFAEIVRDDAPARSRYATRKASFATVAGRPVSLHLIDPTTVTPMLDEQKQLVYKVADLDEPLQAEDILHVAGFGWDGVSGYSPVALFAETLGLAKAEQTWQAGLFGNNATPNGHYELAGKLDKEAKAEFRRQVNAMHGGPSRSGRFGILDAGTKWVQTSFSPSDAQLILGRQFSISEVARVFCLPQHMLGQLDKATLANIEEQNIQFYQLSLMPWLVSIEQEWTRKILPDDEQRRYACWFDPSSLLRGNLQARTNHATAMLRAGVATINDVRDEFGYERVDSPSADKNWVSVNNLAAIQDMDDGKVPRPGTAAPTAPPVASEAAPAEPAAGPPAVPPAKPRAKRRPKTPAEPANAPGASQGPSRTRPKKARPPA